MMRTTNVVQLADYRVRRQAREVIAQARLHVAGEPVPLRKAGARAGARLAPVIALPRPLPERAPGSRR